MFAATKGGGQALSNMDTCKTQAGNTVIVVPYPNQAQLTEAQGAALKVKIVDSEALNLSSNITSSVTGPGAGLIGGVFSNTLNSKCKFFAGSAKVKIEGKPAVRLNDATTQNNVNCSGEVKTPSQTKVKILS